MVLKSGCSQPWCGGADLAAPRENARRGAARPSPTPWRLRRTRRPDTDIAKKKGDLSDKLNSTSGVIHPEGSMDPACRSKRRRSARRPSCRAG